MCLTKTERYLGLNLECVAEDNKSDNATTFLPFLTMARIDTPLDCCWNLFDDWDEMIQSQRDLAEAMEAEGDMNGKQDFLDYITALLAAADKDAGLGVCRFRAFDDDGEAYTAELDFSNKTFKEVVNLLAEWWATDNNGENMSDYRFGEGFERNEDGTFRLMIGS